jgi:hypothetical protein
VSHLAGYADPTKTAIGKETCRVDKYSTAQNIAETCKNIGTDLTQRRSLPVLALSVSSMVQKENAATSAKVNGVKDVVECVCYCGDYIALFPILATHWGTF